MTDKFVYSRQLSAGQCIDNTFLSMISKGLWEKRDNFGVNSGKILPYSCNNARVARTNKFVLNSQIFLTTGTILLSFEEHTSCPDTEKCF